SSGRRRPRAGRAVRGPGQEGPHDPLPGEEEPSMTTSTHAPAVVGVIGGGRMGAGIAQSYATAGSTVTVVESGAEAAAAALDRVATGLKRAAERDLLSESPDDILAR